MKLVNLEQGTQEWLNWRRARICASDIAAICGISPYATPREVWYDKKNKWPAGLEPKKSTFILERGHKFEQVARKEYSKHTAASFTPVCMETNCKRFGASLDGYYPQEAKGIEIKLMGKEDCKALLDFDRIPPHYYHQIQWQMHVGELESVDLIAGDFDGIVVQKVKRNDELIKELKDKALEFIEYLIPDTYAPPMSDDDIYLLDIDDEQEYEAFFDLKENTEALKRRVEEQETALKEKIKLLTQNIPTNYAQYGRIKFSKITRKGNVDYAKIVPVGIDLEKFRKPASSYWQAAIK